MSTVEVKPEFKNVVSGITDIGYQWHADRILANSEYNAQFVEKTIKDLPGLSEKKQDSAIVISAGPSLYKNDILPRIKASGFEGTIISIDGSYVRCLKAGIYPDYMLTLDPHPTRIVRWFGDHDFEKNSEGDDYFTRQDLDIAFRKNSIEENKKNIQLVNEYASRTKLLICSTAPRNVVERAIEAGFDMYWWAPLVDKPGAEDSLTKKIVRATGLPAMNTGGTVGTAAWVFALTALGIRKISVVGMDLGYYKSDTSYQQTQTYYSLKHLSEEIEFEDLFPEVTSPVTGEVFFTDPTYYWYKQNLMSLLKASGSTIYNCTGGGLLFGDGVENLEIEEFVELTR